MQTPNRNDWTWMIQAEQCGENVVLGMSRAELTWYVLMRKTKYAPGSTLKPNADTLKKTPMTFSFLCSQPLFIGRDTARNLAALHMIPLVQIDDTLSLP